MLLILAAAEARRPDPGAAARALRVLDSAPRLAPDLPERRGLSPPAGRPAPRRPQQGRGGGRPGASEAGPRSLPGDAFDRFLYGLELYKQGRPADAIPEFRAARMRDPDLFWARALLALSYARSGHPSEARIVLDECLRDRPEFAWLYLLRGLHPQGLSPGSTRDPSRAGRR